MNDINTKYVADMLQACLAHYCNENGDWLALLRQQLGLRIQRAEARLFIDGRDVHVLLLDYLDSSYAAAVLYDGPGDARLHELTKLPKFDADDVMVAFAAQLCFWEIEDDPEAPCTATGSMKACWLSVVRTKMSGYASTARSSATASSPLSPKFRRKRLSGTRNLPKSSPSSAWH